MNSTHQQGFDWDVGEWHKLNSYSGGDEISDYPAPYPGSGDPLGDLNKCIPLRQIITLFSTIINTFEDSLSYWCK